MIGNEGLDTGFHVTTPEAPDVQRYLSRMVAAGLTHVVLEATSHGLAQHRVTGCEFDVGVVTNITHEHLDYHGTYEAYRQPKAGCLPAWARRCETIGESPRRHPEPDEFLRLPAFELTTAELSYSYQQEADLFHDGEIQYAPVRI